MKQSIPHRPSLVVNGGTLLADASVRFFHDHGTSSVICGAFVVAPSCATSLPLFLRSLTRFFGSGRGMSSGFLVSVSLGLVGDTGRAPSTGTGIVVERKQGRSEKNARARDRKRRHAVGARG